MRKRGKGVSGLAWMNRWIWRAAGSCVGVNEFVTRASRERFVVSGNLSLPIVFVRHVGPRINPLFPSGGGSSERTSSTGLNSLRSSAVTFISVSRELGHVSVSVSESASVLAGLRLLYAVAEVSRRDSWSTCSSFPVDSMGDFRDGEDRWITDPGLTARIVVWSSTDWIVTSEHPPTLATQAGLLSLPEHWVSRPASSALPAGVHG